MYDFVSKQADEESCRGDDENTAITRQLAIYSMQELRTDDHVHAGPANAGKDVEDGDCRLRCHFRVAAETAQFPDVLILTP
jgi:hypothetical protein